MPLKFVNLLGRPFCGQPLNLKGSLKHVSLKSHSISPFSAVISLLMPFMQLSAFQEEIVSLSIILYSLISTKNRGSLGKIFLDLNPRGSCYFKV